LEPSVSETRISTLSLEPLEAGALVATRRRQPDRRHKRLPLDSRSLPDPNVYLRAYPKPPRSKMTSRMIRIQAQTGISNLLMFVPRDV
jgi:hypothetical protein